MILKSLVERDGKIMKKRQDDFSRYMARVKREDPKAVDGIGRELMKLRLSLKSKKLRQKLRKSQIEVALEAGTSQAAVARYERETYTAFELTTLARLAKALNAELHVDLKPKREKPRKVS